MVPHRASAHFATRIRVSRLSVSQVPVGSTVMAGPFAASAIRVREFASDRNRYVRMNLLDFLNRSDRRIVVPKSVDRDRSLLILGLILGPARWGRLWRGEGRLKVVIRPRPFWLRFI